MLLLALTLLGGCTSFIQTVPEETTADCEFETIRGIAVLSARAKQELHFVFHPGDIPVTKSATDSDVPMSVGEEFKAILKVPVSGPCTHELKLADPVSGN